MFATFGFSLLWPDYIVHSSILLEIEPCFKGHLCAMSTMAFSHRNYFWDQNEKHAPEKGSIELQSSLL